MSRFLGSARGRLLAVVDSPDALEAGRQALEAAGAPDTAIEIFTGDEGAAAFDSSGGRHGPLARLLRTVQFTLMDQMPDFAYYEAAARQGRSVVSVKPRNEAEMRRVVEVLRANGGHFINYFGRFTTEEFERWRGQEPELPGFMRR
ncbi:MAG TPA: hypothetical protein VFO73_00030 [Candidatus Limnocylindrales bacterium]|nr:hypothetical protein [Candidatus Limnocylindrales bacterium]